MDFVLNMAGLHPFFLVVACDYVFEQLSVQAQLDTSDYESLRREIGGELEGHFRYYWDTLDRAQQSVLVNLEATQTSSDHAQRLKELMQCGLIVRKDNTYHYFSGSFKEFVLRHQAALFLEHESKSLVGRELGSTRIVGEIGSGGMATVYKAYQPMLDRYVAVKVLSRDVQREGFLPRFRREAQAVAKLDHPNILSIYDFGQEEDLAYIVMRYVPSGTLANLIPPKGLPLDEAVDIAIQIGDALHYAHQQDIVHRDVKPSNILIGPDGRPLLTDFGLVKSLKTPGQLTEPGSMMGTAAYAAPEQFGVEKEVDARSDVYALGIVLYEMVTGRLPFDAEEVVTKKLKEKPPPSPRRFRPDLPEEVEKVILKAIAPQLEDRYQSALEMNDALRSLTESKT
jgi:RIO-like serine/threonine protein kinase